MMMDGRPFADSLAALFDDGLMLNTVVHDEKGGGSFVSWITGTEADGSSSDAHCNGWTSASGEASVGFPSGGPAVWLAQSRRTCNGASSYHILCMGRTRSIPVAVEVSSGKRIWQTRTPYLPGSMTPDQKCQSERPAGVAAGVALISYTTRPASAVLDPEATYVRVDGIAVGTGAMLTTQSIRTGAWLDADGLIGEPEDSIWTGALSPNEVALSERNCQDWTTSTAEGLSFACPHGWSFLFSSGAVPCSEAHRLYCIEP
jgi:hypothetical protein